MFDTSEWITDNTRFVIAVMIIASAVVAAGVPMVDRSTSLDQFQTDADEADALDYVDANFSGGTTDTTSAQVIVQDDNVLDKETLVSILEYQREWAAHLLAGIDDERAETRLRELAGDESEPEIVRSTAARSLEADAGRFRRQFTGGTENDSSDLPGESRLNRRPNL